MNWKAMFGLDPSRNPFLRLSEADRYKVDVRFILFGLAVGLVFLLLGALSK